MDGTAAFFPKQDLSEIYVKGWNAEGQIETIVYKPVRDTKPTQAVNNTFDAEKKNAAYVADLRDKLIAGLERIPHSILSGDREQRLPGNVNFCFEGIEGEALLLLLDAKGICASSGSACTSGSLDPSHVLLAVGVPYEAAHGSLRLSLSEENTPEEVEYLTETIPEVVAYLRGMSPVWRDLEEGRKPHVI